MSGVINLPLGRVWFGPNRYYFAILQAVGEATEDPAFASKLESCRGLNRLDLEELPERWQNEFREALPSIRHEYRKQFEEALEDDAKGKNALNYLYEAEQFTEELILKLDPEVDSESAEAWRSASWWDETYPEYRDYAFVDGLFRQEGLHGTDRRVVAAITRERELRCRFIEARLEIGVDLHGDSSFALLDVVTLADGFLSASESVSDLIVEVEDGGLFRFCNEAYAHPGFRVLEEREQENGREKLFRLLSKVSKI